MIDMNDRIEMIEMIDMHGVIAATIPTAYTTGERRRAAKVPGPAKHATIGGRARREPSMSIPTEQALRESEGRHRFLAELADATQPLSDPAEVMAVTARLLAEHLDVDRCAYAEVEDEDVFVITGDHPRGVPSIVGRWRVSSFGAACARRMLANEPHVVDDVDLDPLVGPDLAAYRATNIQAVICVPLHKEGRFTAAMAVHQKTPRRWTEAEVALVQTVVSRCWEALERGRVVRTLRASEARYRAIVDTTPECVKVVRADGTLLQMNPAGLAMIEAEGRSVIGQSVYRVIAPADREAFRAFNARVCRGEGGSLQFEIVGLRGTRRHMESTAVPLPAPEGGFVHLAITRDITHRVLAERALADSRARLEYAVRLSGLGFWYCDLPFDELSWDERCKAHFWLPPDARVTIETFYARIHPEDREPTRRAIERAIRDHAAYDVDYRTVDPATGACKWLRALGGTSYAADGTPLRFDGVIVDVTARKLDEQRKDEFLALLAHELRNPLAPIRHGVQVLRLTQDPAVRGRTQDMMERQLRHMVRLIDDLLDISRISRNKLELRRARVELAEVVRSAVEAAQPLIDAKRQRLEVALPAAAVVLDADLTRLAQVFSNLLTNSAKYSAVGGHIRLTATRTADAAVVAVADNGIGIPAAALPGLFGMFSQVDRSLERASGGLGIGLALVRGLVEMHGGAVTAESDGPGRGSTFTVRLPLAAPERPEAGSSVVVAAPRPARRVLVVDDNRDAATTMATMLELLGDEVHLAHDGLEAVAAAEALRPELILMDIGMPRLNGYDATRRIRAAPWGQGIVVVALTGWGQAADRAESRAAGCDAHLVKPVDLPDLEGVLAGLGAAR